MKVQKIVVGLACVLAIMVAAQPARAQFLSFAEREAIRQAFPVWQPKTQQQEQKVQEQKQEQQTDKAQNQDKPSANDYLMAGREMKMVHSSEYFFDVANYCWKGICKAGQACWKACKNAAVTAAKYGPGGREGAAMRAGEFFWKTADNMQTPKTSVPLRPVDVKAAKRTQDSLDKALERAYIQALKDSVQQK